MNKSIEYKVAACAALTFNSRVMLSFLSGVVLVSSLCLLSPDALGKGGPPQYYLTVEFGTGDGYFREGRTAEILADDPPPGQRFDRWTGYPVADPTSPNTSLTMPASDVTVTATFVDDGPPPPATFTDHTAQLFPGGLGDVNAAWGDFDNDGYTDVIVAGKVYRNNAGADFIYTWWLGASTWGDYDNDGYLDAYAYGANATTKGQIFRNRSGIGGFDNETAAGWPTQDMPMENSQSASWADFDNDGFVDVYAGGYENFDPWIIYEDALVVNNGNNTFRVAWTDGLERRSTRGVTSCDFDEDGDQDVYLSNYRLEANRLRLNDGNGSFTDVAQSYGVAGDGTGTKLNYGHTIGSSWGDLDNDGHFDLFVGNFAHDKPNGSGVRDSKHDESKFYRNLGPSGSYHFQDMTAFAGLAYQESYANPTLGDYDNDGDLDLFFTTVYPTNNDHCVLYRNDGNWQFTDVTDQEGLSGLTETYQAAWADFDNDGDLDLLTGDQTVGRLFVNGGNPNHWLKVRLIGDGISVNSAAIGAQVRITLGAQTLARQVEGGTGQANQNELTLHFGLGGHSGTVDLEIAWPDSNRTIQNVYGVAVDQVITVTR